MWVVVGRKRREREGGSQIHSFQKCPISRVYVKQRKVNLKVRHPPIKPK